MIRLFFGIVLQREHAPSIHPRFTPLDAGGSGRNATLPRTPADLREGRDAVRSCRCAELTRGLSCVRTPATSWSRATNVTLLAVQCTTRRCGWCGHCGAPRAVRAPQRQISPNRRRNRPNVLESRPGSCWTSVHSRRADGRYFCRMGPDPAAAPRTCRSKSRASVRCAAPAAMPTATITSAATSRCEKSATTRARRSSTACIALVDAHTPLHLSIVGGEPLVRFRELNDTAAAARRARASTRSSSRARSDRSRSSGPASTGCSSSCRSTASSPSTTCAGRRPPTIASSSTSRDTDHRPLHGDAAAGAPPGLPRRVRRLLVERIRTPGRSGSASTRRRSARSPRNASRPPIASASSPT